MIKNRWHIIRNTLGGRNPAPPGMYKPNVNNGGKLPTSTGEFAGFLNHQQYDSYDHELHSILIQLTYPLSSFYWRLLWAILLFQNLRSQSLGKKPVASATWLRLFFVYLPMGFLAVPKLNEWHQFLVEICHVKLRFLVFFTASTWIGCSIDLFSGQRVSPEAFQRRTGRYSWKLNLSLQFVPNDDGASTILPCRCVVWNDCSN